MLPGIDTEDVICAKDIKRNNSASHRHETFRRIGEVILALRVTSTDLFQGMPEFRKLKDIATGINFPDRAFFGVAVALLNDSKEVTGRVAKNPAKPQRLVHYRGAEQTISRFRLFTTKEVGQGLGTE